MLLQLYPAVLLLLVAWPCAAQPRPDDEPTPRGQAPGNARPIEDCEVIARVNGQVVTACEVLWLVNLMTEGKIEQVPVDQRPAVRDRLMRQQLMEVLDVKMLYADFRRRAPEFDLKAIHESLDEQFEQEEIPRLAKRVGVEDVKHLPVRLVELGTSLRDRRANFYETTLARGWMQEQIDFSREVPRDELLAWYREHAAEYEFPTQARWEELVVLFSRYTGPAEQRRSEAYAELAEIGNAAFLHAESMADKTRPAFGELAKQHSHGFNADGGGLYDWTTKGALADPRIDNALFTLPVGEMSPILRSKLGWHIVRVVERREAGRTPFTEVQSAIRRKILDRRSSEAFASKLRELRGAARIWTKWDGYLDPPDPPRAPAER